MDILSKYLFPVFQAPDSPAAAEQPPEPTVAVDTGTTSEPEPAEPSKSEPKPHKPIISEITQLRIDRRSLENELARVRREAAEAKQLAERLQRGSGQQDSSTLPQPPTPQSPNDAEVDRRAEYKLFVRDVETLKQNGLKEFGPAFHETVNILRNVGADDDAFVQAVLAVDRTNAHGLLNAVAQDPERAIALVGMQPANRIAELTRMSIAMTDKAKTPVSAPAAAAPVAPPAQKQMSKAPPPPPPIDTGNSKTIDWRSDEASDDEFTRGFNEMMQKRHAIR